MATQARKKADPPADRDKTLAILEILRERYGPRRIHGDRDPLDELVLTILSQNTSDRNSGRAYRLLRARYRSWAEVLDADPGELTDTIRVGGLANIKAARIQNTLRALLERRGELNLDFLRELPLEEARSWLTSLPGIGPKTAGCVLCFACHQPAMIVDTHIHRVAKRTGMIGPKVSADAAHDLLEAAVPPEDAYQFHASVLLHGRQVCHAQRPRCERCPLTELCDYYAATAAHPDQSLATKEIHGHPDAGA
ncbi:MAG TPA: endonuclease III [Herpetosiphonaceae bacterium]